MNSSKELLKNETPTSSNEVEKNSIPAKYDIPFNWPYLTGREMEYIAAAMESGHISGDGEFTLRCQKLLESVLGCKKVLLTTSCTHALEMAALLLELKPGDEVIVPSFTFVSTVNAFVLRGAVPVFCDIDPHSLNLDVTMVSQLIGPRTKAIVPVHYASMSCAMNDLLKLAENASLKVVEDNAQGLFGKYNNQYLGTFGGLATVSFHETKNLQCGEGGALLINDPFFMERAEFLREKGTNRKNFFRGQVDKYTWVDIGSSYLPSDILAAHLLAQLEKKEEIFKLRETIWTNYKEKLTPWAEANGVTLSAIPDNCEPFYHLFYMLLKSENDRNNFISFMKEKGILTTFHYLPLHLSPMGLKAGGKLGDCPITEDISGRLVRLPFYNELSAAQQNKVIEAIFEYEPSD